MKILLLSLVIACVAVGASGVNFSGKWVMETPGSRAGQTVQTTLVLNHVGGEVIGTIATAARSSSGAPAGREILDGKVENDTISFYVWGGRSDRPAKTFYKGTMSGDEIVFAVSGPGLRGGESGPREMRAKRSK